MMNIYGIIILLTIAIGFFLDTIADILNLGNLRMALPEEFQDVYSGSRYEKSQEYTRTKTRFGFISSSFSLVVMLVFWFASGFNLLDVYVSSISDNTILRGIIYIGILGFASSLLSLPFGIYSTFVIEERFGFNKTTIGTFILDILKSLGLTILIGAPLLYGILNILENAGQFAWLYGWAAVVLFSLFMQWLAPRWLMPIFNKFTPMEDGELKSRILELAERVKFPVKQIFVMDGSKRTAKTNAFFTGFGRNKRIVLFDTLIAKHSVDELIAVLAHEIGHYKKKHIQKGMLISILHYGILFYLLSIFLNEKELYQAFFMDSQPIYAGLLFFGMLYSPVEMLLSLFANIYSRRNEYQADKFAAEAVKSPQPLIDALKKLSSENLSNLTPHPFYVFINYSHPPLLERIRAVKTIIKF